MANNQGRLGFSIDFKKGDQSGLRELKQQPLELQQLTITDIVDSSSITDATTKLSKVQETAQKVASALKDSYNAKLDTTDLTKFQKSLESSGLSLASIKQDFQAAGVQGQIAFRNLNTELLTTNKYMKQSNEWLDKMANTLSNTVRWTIASTAVNSVTGSIQKAYTYTKQLDSSLNDIRIVTEKSSDEMDRFARQANKAAKALGATTTDYTKASLIYYQQGLNDEEVAARAAVTTKVANVTGVSADAASEQLTAIWNGYKVSAQEAELYIDKVSAVAASTAADLEELSIGMSRVASAANIMGVDIDQLNAQLATIVSITREAPESIGTALKTVYARMSDIEAGLDTETSLGEYTKQMEQMGINALDAKGNLRDMGEVVEEIGEKWGTLTRNQQTSLAQTIAGTRQYSRMMALFDNWDMYEQAKATSQGSAGALGKQNEIYLDSMEAHLNELQAAAEGLYDSLLDPESLNGLIDGLTNIVELLDQMVQGLGGGGNLLMTIGSIGMNVFSNQISRGISSSVRNAEGLLANMRNINAQAELFKETLANVDDDKKYKTIVETYEKLNEYSHLMTEEERQQSALLFQKSTELLNQESILEEQRQHAEKMYEALTGDTVDATTKKGAEEIANLFEAGTMLNELKTVEGLSDLAIEQDLIRRKRRQVGARKGALTRAQKEDFASSDISAVNIGGAEIETDYFLNYDSKNVEAAKSALNERKDQLEELEAQQKKNLENFENEIENFEISVDTLKVFEKLDIFSKEELDDLKRASKLFEDIKKNGLDPSDIDDARAAMDNYGAAIDKAKTAVKKSQKEIEKYNESIKKTRNLQDEANKSFDKFIKSLNVTKAIDGVVNLAGGLANISTSINNLKNLGSIWSDEDLSGGEKFLQTVTNISFTLPMLVTGFTNLKKGAGELKGLVTQITASYYNWNKAAAAKSLLDKASVEDLKSEVFWKAIENTLTKDGTEALDKNTAALLEKAKAGDIAAQAELKQTLGETAHTITLKGVTAGLKSATKAAWEFAAALLANPITWIVVGIVAVGAAIGGLVKQINDFNTKEERALESMKKDLAEATNATNELIEAHNRLAEAVDSWTSKTNAIDDMVKGTQEYRDAIYEANNNLLDLIDTYPELIDKVKESTEHQGLLTIATEDMDKALSSAKAREYEARAIEYGMRARMSEQQAQINVADKARDVKTGWQTAGEVGSGAYLGGVVAGGGALAGYGLALGGLAAATTAGVTVGATAGSVIPVIGTVIGAALGLIGGIAVSIATTSTDIQEANEETVEAVARFGAEHTDLWAKNTDEFKAALRKGLDIHDEALLNELAQNKDALHELSETIKQADLKEQLERQAQAENYLASLGNARYDNSEYQKQIASEIALNDEQLEAARKNAQARTDEENHRELAERMGWEYVSNGNGVGKFSKKTADGSYETFEMNDDSIREMNAQYQALKESGKDLNAIMNAIDKVAVTSSEAVNQQLANVVTQQKVDLKNLTSKERELFAETLKNLGLLSHQELIALGVSGINVIEDFANEALENIKDYRDKIRDNNINNQEYRDQFDALFKEGGALKNEDLSFQTEEYIAKIYGTQNDALIKQFKDFLSSGLLKAEDLGEVLNMLPGLDSYQDIEAFEKNLFNSEFSDLLRNDVFKSLIDSLQQSFDLFKTYDDIAEEINLYKDVREAIQQKGDSITAEQYEQLTPEMQTYFQLMVDGTAILTKDAREFAKAAREAELQVVRDKIEKARSAVKDYQADIDNFTEEDKLRLDRINKLGEVPNLGILGNVGVYGNPGVWYSSLSAESISGGITWEELMETDVGQFLQAKGYTEQDFSERYMGNMVGSENLTEFFEDTIQPLLREEALDKVRQLKSLGISNPLIESYLDDDWNSSTFQAATAWIEEAVKRVGKNGSILANEQSTANAASGQISQAKKDEIAAQEELAAMAQSYTEFLSFIDSGDITDEGVINEWTKYWKQQEKGIFRYTGELERAENKLNDITNELDKVAEAYENAFGEEKLRLLEKQKDLLEQQRDALKDQKMFLGFQLLANENDVVNKAFALFGEDSDLALSFANQGITEKLVDSALLKGRQDVEENPELASLYQNFLDSLSTYWSTEDLIEQVKDQELENLRSNLQTNLENVNVKFSPTLDVQSMKREYNNFLREISIEEDDFGGLGEFYKKDFDSLTIDVLAYQQKLAELDSKQIITAEELERMRANNIELTEDMILQEDYITAKQELQANFQDTLLSLKEQMTQINELQISQLDEISEAYDTQISYLEDINSLYDHLISINELLYGDKARANTANLYKTQIENQNQILKKRKEEYEYYLAQSQDVRLDEDTRAHAREQAAATAQEIAAISAELAQAITDDFNASIEFMVSNLFTGLQDAKEEWNWLKSESDRVYNDLTKSFEIAKFENEINKAINSTTSINAQRQLNKLREEELKALEEKEQLTKYDFDRAQARFELLQAQIALEEAQANKTKMQLVRGADGTYGYEYVADTDAVSEKTQAVLDAQQKVLDLDREEVQSHYDGILDATEEFVDAFIKVFKDGEITDEEEEWLQKMLDSLNAQVADATPIIENLRKTAEDSGLLLGKSFGELTDEEMAQLFPELDSRMYEAIKDLVENGGISQTTFDNLIEQAKTAGGEWKTTLSNFLTELGLDGEGLIAKTTTSGGIYDLMNEDQIEILNEGKTAMEALAEKGNAVKLAYEKMYQPIVDVTNALYEFNKQATLGIMPTKLAFNSGADSLSYKEGLQAKIGSMSIAEREQLYRSWGLSDFVLRQEGFDPKEDFANFDTLLAQIIDNEDWKNLLRFLPYIQFDTGGYTGEWGGDGRLALLHEKELVLNQEDTSNILDAIELVRKLQFSLDASLSSRLGDMMQSYETSMAAWEMAKDWIIEQTVQIQAEFPGVTDQNEIVEAFNILTNMATQKVAENSNL